MDRIDNGYDIVYHIMRKSDVKSLLCDWLKKLVGWCDHTIK